MFHVTPEEVQRFYRHQSKIYDRTRWLFLFGRNDILSRIIGTGSPSRILEVGCGTGRNLAELGRLLPAAHLTGVDLSSAMLDCARKKLASFGDRIQLLHQRYDRPVSNLPNYDVVLFSYSLSMFNPGLETAIEAVRKDLLPGGCIAVVDFHDSRWRWFLTWMKLNHVRTDGQLRPLLQRDFTPIHDELRTAYGSAWRYLLYLGRQNSVGSLGNGRSPGQRQPNVTN